MKKDSEIICVIKDPGEQPIVAVGVDGEEFVSLMPDQIQFLMRLLREPKFDLRGGAL